MGNAFALSGKIINLPLWTMAFVNIKTLTAIVSVFGRDEWTRTTDPHLIRVVL